MVVNVKVSQYAKTIADAIKGIKRTNPEKVGEFKNTIDEMFYKIQGKEANEIAGSIIYEIGTYFTSNKESEFNLDKVIKSNLRKYKGRMKEDLSFKDYYSKFIKPVIYEKLGDLFGEDGLDYLSSNETFFVCSLVNENLSSERKNYDKLVLASVIYTAYNTIRDLGMKKKLSEYMRKKYIKRELNGVLAEAYDLARRDKRGFRNSRIASENRLIYIIAAVALDEGYSYEELREWSDRVR